MLPDFPEHKERLSKIWRNYLQRKRQEYLGYVATIPSYRQHEGSSFCIERDDGTICEAKFEEASTPLRFDWAEIPKLSPPLIMQKLDAAAKDMAKQVGGGFFGMLHKATDATGMTEDARGELGWEHILNAFEKVDWSFDDRGNPVPPDVVLHPSIWERIKNKVLLWEQDPAYKERYNRIIEAKREAWRDRESRRKLVD